MNQQNFFLKKRQKSIPSKIDINNNNINTNTQHNNDLNRSTHSESSEEMEPLPSCPNGEGLAQDKADIEVFDSALKNLSPKWKNWIVRGIFGIIMITGFSFIVSLGK